MKSGEAAVGLLHELDHLEAAIVLLETAVMSDVPLALGELDVAALLAGESVTDRALAEASRVSRAAEWTHAIER